MSDEVDGGVATETLTVGVIHCYHNIPTAKNPFSIFFGQKVDGHESGRSCIKLDGPNGLKLARRPIATQLGSSPFVNASTFERPFTLNIVRFEYRSL